MMADCEAENIAVGRFLYLTFFVSPVIISKVCAAEGSLDDLNPSVTSWTPDCTSTRCSDNSSKDDSDDNTEVGRIIAVVGGSLVILLLLLFCFLRVRCMAKRSQARRSSRQMRGRGQSNRVNSECSTIFALSREILPLGEVIVQLPPYSELDPIASPSPNYTGFNGPAMIIDEPPPPYSDVKNEENVEMQSAASGRLNDDRAQCQGIGAT